MKLHRLLFLLPAMLLAAGHAITGAAQAPLQSVDDLTLLTRAQRNSKVYDNNGIFTHLDVGLSFGSGGLGIDLSTNVTRYGRIRAGVDWMPPFTVPMSFSIETYTDGAIHQGNFATLQKYMYKLTGIEVDDKVDIDGKPHMAQAKILLDYYPVPDLGLRLTAGLFIGKKRVAHALNTMGEMPSLLAVNIYNKFHDYVMETDFYDTPIYDSPETGPIFLDPALVDKIRDELNENGYLGIHVGDFKDGTPYIMHPDKKGMVKANMLVNAVRPYLGLGYTTPFTHEKRMIFDVDLGVMFWGGSPRIVTHENVDLTHDVVNIKGRVGDYVRLTKKFSVYPMLNFRLSFRAL